MPTTGDAAPSPGSSTMSSCSTVAGARTSTRGTHTATARTPHGRPARGMTCHGRTASEGTTHKAPAAVARPATTGSAGARVRPTCDSDSGTGGSVTPAGTAGGAPVASCAKRNHSTPRQRDRSPAAAAATVAIDSTWAT